LSFEAAIELKFIHIIDVFHELDVVRCTILRLLGLKRRQELSQQGHKLVVLAATITCDAAFLEEHSRFFHVEGPVENGNELAPVSKEGLNRIRVGQLEHHIVGGLLGDGAALGVAHVGDGLGGAQGEFERKLGFECLFSFESRDERFGELEFIGASDSLERLQEMKLNLGVLGGQDVTDIDFVEIIAFVLHEDGSMTAGDRVVILLRGLLLVHHFGFDDLVPDADVELRYDGSINFRKFVDYFNRFTLVFILFRFLRILCDPILRSFALRTSSLSCFRRFLLAFRPSWIDELLFHLDVCDGLSDRHIGGD